jgi:arsenate reductase
MTGALAIRQEQQMDVVIYHNPACGTSRNALAALRDAGFEPTIVEYLKTPPDRKTLGNLLARMGKKPRDILRRRGTPYDDLGLDDPAVDDDAIFAAIEANPILIERPIVVIGEHLALCRPFDIIHELIARARE